MNYYQHHLGDYAKDTAHLSMLEHGAYRLLLDRYYGTERGIPEGQVYRVARARTPEEIQAVDIVLEEFFTLEDGVWTNGRTELEIERFNAAEPDREARKANEKRRIRNHRQERTRLFTELKEAGIRPTWNIGIEDLRDLASSSSQRPVTEPVTEPVTLDDPFQVTAPATPATATQTPIANSQYKITTTTDARVRDSGFLDQLEFRLRDAAGKSLDPTSQGLHELSRPLGWLDQGMDMDADILPAIRLAASKVPRQGSVRTWKYFDGAVADAHARRIAPMPSGKIEHEQNRRPSTVERRNEVHMRGIADAVDQVRGRHALS